MSLEIIPTSPRWTNTRRDSLSLRDVSDMLFRNKLWTSLGLLLVLGSAVAFVVLSPRLYRSEMLFLLKSERPQTGLGSNNSITVISRELSESQMATEVQLLTSDELLSAVLVKTGLVKENASGRVMDRALQKLRRDLRVTPGLRSDIVAVSVTADSTDHAAFLLSTLSDLYLEKHLAIHKVSGGYEFFRDQTNKATADLHRAQGALAEFEQANNTILLDQQKAEKVKSVGELQNALRETDAAQKDAQARNEVLEKQVSAAAPRITTQSRTVPNQYSLERLNTMLLELRNKRTELLVKFQPTDRMVQQVDEQIAQTLAALGQVRSDSANEEATDVNPIRQALQSDLLLSRNRLAGLSGRAGALRIQVMAGERELNRLSAATGHHDDLVRAVKEAESYYQTLATQFEQVKLTEQMDQQHVTNVAVAEAPTRIAVPEPRITTNIVAATVLGVLLVFGIALLCGMRRSRVFTPWELEGLTGVPVLGAVPMVPRKGLRTQEALTL
jgi:polysaccharide biosynthesis protein PslE